MEKLIIFVIFSIWFKFVLILDDDEEYNIFDFFF